MNFPGKVGYNFLISSFFNKKMGGEGGEEGEEEGEEGVVMTEFGGRSFLPVDCMVRSCYYDLSVDEKGEEVFIYFSYYYSYCSLLLLLLLFIKF